MASVQVYIEGDGGRMALKYNIQDLFDNELFGNYFFILI